MRGEDERRMGHPSLCQKTRNGSETNRRLGLGCEPKRRVTMIWWKRAEAVGARRGGCVTAQAGDWRLARLTIWPAQQARDDKHMARSPLSGSTCRYDLGKSRHQHSSKSYHYIQVGVGDEVDRPSVPERQQSAVQHAYTPPRPILHRQNWRLGYRVRPSPLRAPGVSDMDAVQAVLSTLPRSRPSQPGWRRVGTGGQGSRTGMAVVRLTARLVSMFPFPRPR